MKVEIEYNSFLLRKITGTQHKRLDLPSHISLRQVIDELVKIYGDRFRRSVMQENGIKPKMMIVVNGKNITEMGTLIETDSKINFFQLATSG